MRELLAAVTELAGRQDTQAGPVPIFLSGQGEVVAPGTCDVCSCNITRCSGGPCCF